MIITVDRRHGAPCGCVGVGVSGGVGGMWGVGGVSMRRASPWRSRCWSVWARGAAGAHLARRGSRRRSARRRTTSPGPHNAALAPVCPV